MNFKIAILKYDIPDQLPLSYGHKLRGFFADNFSELLFHNHKQNGEFRYGYPLIQYKIVNKKPMIIAINEGADLIIEHFVDIDELRIGDRCYKDPSGKFEILQEKVAINRFPDQIYSYELVSPWMGLSQKNYKDYIKLKEKHNNENILLYFLGKILVGNVLSFAKGINWWIEEEIVVIPELKEITISFKNKGMIGFIGKFSTNALLPDFIGIGKSVSRGFGILKKCIKKSEK